MIRVGDMAHLLMRRVEPLHALAKDAEAVDHDEALNAHIQQMAADGDAGRAGAVDDDLDLADVLLDELQRVQQQGGAGFDPGAQQGNAGPVHDDNVVDAEYEVVDDK